LLRIINSPLLRNALVLRARRKGLLPAGIIALFASRWKRETGAFRRESNVKLWRLVTKLSKHRVAGPVRITELTCIPMSVGKARNIKRMQRRKLVFRGTFPSSLFRLLSRTAAHQARSQNAMSVRGRGATPKFAATFSKARPAMGSGRRCLTNRRSFSIRHAIGSCANYNDTGKNNTRTDTKVKYLARSRKMDTQYAYF